MANQIDVEKILTQVTFTVDCQVQASSENLRTKGTYRQAIADRDTRKAAAWADLAKQVVGKESSK